MTPRRFALVMGIVYLVVGVLGFVPGLVAPPHPGHPELALDAGYGRLFGLFPINVLHNLVHAGIGLWGIAAYSNDTGRSFSRGLAILYGAFTVMGLFPGLRTTFGLVPLFGHDVWLHAVTAAVAAYFGWAVEPVRERAARHA